MKFSVQTLPIAEADFETLYEYIAERSPDGANAWAKAFEVACQTLSVNAGIHALAPESSDVDIDVRQVIFKTRRGNPYRLLY